MKLTKEEKMERKRNMPYRRLLSAILIFLILTFVASAGLLADAVYTKYVTYHTIGSIVSGLSTEPEEKAEKQGNLGNYDVASVKNTVVKNDDGSCDLMLELAFTNYGKEGVSFNEAVSAAAYQNDKEVTSGAFDILSDSPVEDEANIKVRNGQSATVVLQLTAPSAKEDVKLELSTPSKQFTYTIKLSAVKQNKK